MIVFRLNEEVGLVTEDFEYLHGTSGPFRIDLPLPLSDDPFCHCAGDRCACLDDPWFAGSVGSGDPHDGRL